MLQSVTGRAALDFEAPYLIEKLVKNCIAADAEEAQALFLEVKRFLVFARNDKSRIWDVYSVRVDEAWHQFILFTQEYVAFCRKFFGHYLHHSPGNAPAPAAFAETEGADARPASTFEEFKEHYEAFFGFELPACWNDVDALGDQTRLLSDGRDFSVTCSDDGSLVVRDGDGCDVFSVNDIALDALAFALNTPSFFVRELPGDLSPEERRFLASTLVRLGVLAIAA